MSDSARADRTALCSISTRHSDNEAHHTTHTSHSHSDSDVTPQHSTLSDRTHVMDGKGVQRHAPCPSLPAAHDTHAQHRQDGMGRIPADIPCGLPARAALPVRRIHHRGRHVPQPPHHQHRRSVRTARKPHPGRSHGRSHISPRPVLRRPRSIHQELPAHTTLRRRGTPMGRRSPGSRTRIARRMLCF